MPTLAQMEKPQPVSRALRIALGICQRLEELGHLHGGLRPEIVAVAPEVQRVELLPTRCPSRSRADTLTYAAPEQSGRMNRGIDTRSDLYSFGVLLYEMLSGSPPFASEDPLELIHWHLARDPAPLEGCPDALQAIVAKLLAKNPDARYQTVAGLRSDLERCINGEAAFALGEHDVPDSVRLPADFYGRTREQQRLLRAFETAMEGHCETVFVSGPPGIGKTTLIQQVVPALIRRRGYLAKGKFDQIAGGTPYSALIQALNGLFEELLAEGPAAISRWRELLQTNLREGVVVIADVLPITQSIIGDQQSPPPLGPTDSQVRFETCMTALVCALAGANHPLVLFLDDLQWADAATLRLLAPLAECASHLLIIGAYRDADVGPDHPLVAARASLEKARPITNLSLSSLEEHDIAQLLADTLRRAVSEIRPLAQTLQNKTEGNPFFLLQFLRKLGDDGILRFDRHSHCWQFDMVEVERMPVTDNVVELLTQRIENLTAAAQLALQVAACAGTRFTLPTIAAGSNQTPQAVRTSLTESVAHGLLHWDGEEYSFAHDRVQQAAYATLSVDQRAWTHLRIGKHLLRESPANQTYELALHWNAARELLSTKQDLEQLAAINAEAGRKAASGAAWQAAAGYFQTASELFGDTIWESRFDECFQLHVSLVECMFALCQFDDVVQRAEGLIARARTPAQLADAVYWRKATHETHGELVSAIDVCTNALEKLGVAIPEGPQELEHHLERELQSIDQLRAGREFGELRALTEARDEKARAVVRLLNTVWIPIAGSGNILRQQLIGAMITRYFFEFGGMGDAGFGMTQFGVVMAARYGDLRSGAEFAKLGISISERFGKPRDLAESRAAFFCTLQIYCDPVSAAVEQLRNLVHYSRRNLGDSLWAAYLGLFEVWYRLASGEDLTRVLEELRWHRTWLHQTGMAVFEDTIRVQEHFVLALQDEIAVSLDGNGLSARPYADALAQSRATLIVGGDPPIHIAHYAVARVMLAFLWGHHDDVVTVMAQGAPVIGPYIRTIPYEIAHVFHALSLSALDAPAASAVLREECQFLHSACELCPQNFRAWHLIVSAEIAKREGDPSVATRLLLDAVEDARELNNLLNGALAAERLGNLWLERGSSTLGTLFLSEARRQYAAWGALAKAKEMSGRYPQLRQTENVIDLDVATVIKAARAISSQVVTADFLAELLRITIESAGARRGCFVQETKSGLQIEAAAEVTGIVRRGEPLEHADGRLLTSAVHYVRRTGEPVVVGNVASDARFRRDPFTHSAKTCSVMCLPIRHRGIAQGILYLENDLATEAFTSDRVRVIEVLAAQAAVSLENARLFEDVSREAEKRKQAEEMLRSIVEGTASATGLEFFQLLVQHLAGAIGVRYAFVTEASSDLAIARMLAYWSGPNHATPFEYKLEKTPCSFVMSGKPLFISDGIQQQFPFDRDLADLGARGYSGMPLTGSTGRVIGHLAVLHDQPIAESPQRADLLRIFAARATAELERMRATERLHTALSEVETLKNRLHAENVYLQEEIRREHDFEEIVGNSPELTRVLSQVGQVAGTDSTVLIYGETGTGKELIARAVHERSTRRGRPLVKVNCGAISSGLVESELFGHVKGAFTGAIDKRVGRFELAHGGTIFLDEVGELPLDVQVKLLRVLQEQEFESVGSSRTVEVDVRVIAATNRNLTEEVSKGRFRSDLYYRLSVFPLTVPPLRERRADIPALVVYFLQRFARKMGRPVSAVTNETMDRMVAYEWPGNIRELQNVVERAVVLAHGPNLSIAPELLPLTTAATRIASANPAAETISTALADIERTHIVNALATAKWVIEGPNGAAAILNLHPNTLRSRLKKMGIHRPVYGVGSN